MGADSFPGWITRIRKDPLGANGLNNLKDRYRWAETLFKKEHLLAAGSVGTAGEHNAAEIPREVGSVYITGGPTGNKEGFRYATGATRSAMGTIQLALNSALYPDTTRLSLQVQNCSEESINKPALTFANIVSTSRIDFFSKYLSDDLAGGAAPGNTFTASDQNFCVAIHAPPLANTGAVTLLTKFKGDYLTEEAPDWNALVQADASLRYAFLNDGVGTSHSTAGVHACREVARTWADIYYSGGAYRIRSSSARNPCATATTVGTGHCRLAFTTAWALSAQPFVMTSYAASAGGAVGDIYCNGTPRSLITTTQVEIYLYKYDTAAHTWSHADTDFYITVHGG